MGDRISLEISEDVYGDLMELADTLGYPPEAALSYAVRLVNACIREGLIGDMPAPKRETGEPGKVLAFPNKKD